MTQGTQASEAGDPLLERLRAFTDRPAAPGLVARDPVNVPMIRHWCDALGDTNPAYADGAVAPPAMLQTWCMDRGADDGGVVTEVMDALTAAGFTSVVATNYDQEYLRQLAPGDRLVEERRIEEVSPRKRTALGEGHFVTMLNTYRDASGALVGTSRMRVLRFRPEPVAPKPTRPLPPVNRDTAFFWEGTARGVLLAQRCGDCATLRHPPAPMCGSCGSLAWDSVELSGEGAVHSWVVHHHPPLPGFELPVVVVLADLDDGVRLVADLPGVAPAQLRAGLRVSTELVAIDGGVRLPRFRLAEAAR